MSAAEIEWTDSYDAAAAHVAANMREEDVREVWLLGGRSPEEAVRLSIEASSEAYIARVHREPVALLGVATPTLGGHGVPWLLGTRGMDGGGAELIRMGRSFTDHLLERCEVLENVALASNRKTLVFLSRIGFAISKPFLTPSGAAAVAFTKRRPACAIQ